MNPASTYRIQFQKEFTFTQFRTVLPYLKKLGVNTVYASPIFESVPGSTHGYDGLNPHRINPEIGKEEDLREIHADLKDSGMQWLQDIVPNHMAFDHRNPWLMDVFEKGKDSAYASFFDSSISSDFYSGKLMAPFLGDPLAKVIDKGELKLEYLDEKFVLSYYDSRFPVNEASKALIFNDDNVSLDTDDSIHTRLSHINSRSDLLKHIADEQFYELCCWRDTNDRINYRRFFTVNGLICLNIQNEETFGIFHQYIKKLADDGIFNGVRIDHIDGLFDPASYLSNLRNLMGPDMYIVAEKILEKGELMPADWPIEGNTGYDFLGMVNNIFTNRKSEDAFTSLYQELTPHAEDVESQVYEKKAAILFQNMSGELENLYQLFVGSNFSKTGISENEILSAIAYFLIYIPVYRYYGNSFPLKDEEANNLKAVFKQIKVRKPQLRAATDLLEKILLFADADEEQNAKALYFYQRCMQFSGPLMAKGVEDTLMYTYNRFIGHNEVGDSPESFGISSKSFHKLMVERQQLSPFSINTTSTHDTKRGEDVRARVNVLTDIPEKWAKKVRKWMKLNESLKISLRPDLNDEYLIYQTMIGAYPMPGENEDNFIERFQEYITKALREAKVQTSWTNPNEQYEEAAKTFALKLFDRERPFWQSFEKLHSQIADFGIVNSLSQLLLKFMCPGIPDVYQGCELWDFSLVDPDNRRAVDYSRRAEMLEKIESREEDLSAWLWENRYSGEIKLWLTQTLLTLRNEKSGLFEKGDYIPLKVRGRYKKNVLAFARQYEGKWLITAVPLHLASLCEEQGCGLKGISWENTRICIPASAPSNWVDLLSGSRGKSADELPASTLFSSFPFALLQFSENDSGRSAGVLLHISSLPSPFGVGDFGPEAFKFADFLTTARQKYWQMLPLNPIEDNSLYSPYSSFSSMAGNPLFISPELLTGLGVLDPSDLERHRFPEKSVVDYKGVAGSKNNLLRKAFENYKKQEADQSAFKLFCENESYWLEDFALYMILKQEFGDLPWYKWPENFRLKDKESIKDFSGARADELEEVKWYQFIFSQQWHDLKNYCNRLGIHLFGDMPFYTSYDSADVWANREIFCLDESGKITGIAGVPPDYFNDNGQLWGMPVFRWDVLKERGYDWWIQRIRKNAELFDLIRFDHFRAFSSYWDVPAGETTAKNGTWKPGPGEDFFKTVEEQLGKIPFVAEDLGDIDRPVYDLRDKFELPGMKVLQFAFGDDMPDSLNIPHHYEQNFFVYTGTHDNNTSLGWYKRDANRQVKDNLSRYAGKKVSRKNVHAELIRLAYASVAKTVIVPVQDIIGLDEKSRMNSPATTEGNWVWRLVPGQIKEKHAEYLRKLARLYGRA